MIIQSTTLQDASITSSDPAADPSPLISHFTHALPWAKLLHWVTAVVVVVLFVFGIIMTQLGSGDFANWLFSSHKMLGVVALLLLCIRLIYRGFMSLRGRWNQQSSLPLVHWLLYGVGLLVPLLGWAAISDYGARGVFFGLSLPKIWPEGAGYSGYLFTAHAWLAFGLMAAVVVHIGVALHDYVTRAPTAQGKSADS
jgi:cytochrome b561